MRLILSLLVLCSLGKAQWMLLEKTTPLFLSPGPNAKPQPSSHSLALWSEEGEDDALYLFGSGHMWRYEIPNKRWLWQPETPNVVNRTNAAYWSVQDVFYMYGGARGTQVLNDMWAYNPKKRIFTQIPLSNSLPCTGSAFWKHETTNKLYMWGGICGMNATTNHLRAFDINSQTWTENVPTHDGGTGIPAGAVYVAATLGEKDTVYLYTDDKLWMLDLLKFTWTQAKVGNNGSPPGPGRIHHTMWTTSDGAIMLYGGKSGTKEYVDTWRYEGDHWKLEDVGNGPSPRTGFTACTDFSGNLLLFGGGDTNDLFKYGKFTVKNVFELIEWKLDSATLTASVAAVMSSLVFFGLVVLAIYLCIRHCIKKRKKNRFGAISEPVLRRGGGGDGEYDL